MIKAQENQAGRFILATNLLEEERKLTRENSTEKKPEKGNPDILLKEYKAQQPTERDFRFLKRSSILCF